VIGASAPPGVHLGRLPAFTGTADDRGVIARHTLVQLTDLHLLPEGRLLRDRLDTFDVLARALAEIERSGVRPTALLFTGDLTEAGEPGAYQRLRALVEPVAARMGTTALYVMGNHDSRPELREHLLGQDRGDEPYDHTVRLGGLRVVVLDTTVPGFSHGELTGEQLDRLAAELAEPAPDGTVLALHHPPLPTPSRIAASIDLRNRKELEAVLSGTDVRIVLAGHTHVVSAGAVAGIPVWTGGTTAFASGAFAVGGGESQLLSPTANRVDLFDDSLIVTTVAMNAEHVTTLTPAEVDDLIARIDR
jgi:3',5'-cyclic AMP phosphodiesterase CpdA